MLEHSVGGGFDPQGLEVRGQHCIPVELDPGNVGVGVLPKHRAVVFAHGCFWHRHEGCHYATVSATRPELWRAKFDANAARDSAVRPRHLEEGWRRYGSAPAEAGTGGSPDGTPVDLAANRRSSDQDRRQQRTSIRSGPRCAIHRPAPGRARQRNRSAFPRSLMPPVAGPVLRLSAPGTPGHTRPRAGTSRACRPQNEPSRSRSASS